MTVQELIEKLEKIKDKERKKCFAKLMSIHTELRITS